ncbi:SNF2 super family [Chlorella sorokiniana]|uniref:SNF2 super family n=1 Tax=Chlorella sorokiniana TaxID=3076 RepID=A0A2P6U3H3_CHLSO|nr:SNF2 super family [Chlorella sorokiniana]|eukprot:PRW60864.1 SNF2 super family [Chlorella sorokiniana]
MRFSVGDACEVAGSPEDGFAAAWFRGRVERVILPSARTAVSDVLEISFPDFIRPDGTAEIEHHPARSLRVRPTQPAPAVPAMVAEYQIGDAVDVRVDSVWWHGVIIDRHAGRGAHAFFVGSHEQEWVDDPTCLRPGRIWVAGRWHTRPLPPSLPKGLLRKPAVAVQQKPKQQQAQQQQAQQAQQQAQPKKQAQAQRAASHDENDESATVLVRRSARERESRIVMVDGKPVLKMNMYDLEGGERSVFEQELHRRKSGKGGVAADGPVATWVAVQHPAKKRKSEAGTAVPAGGQPGGFKAGGEHSDGEEAGPTSPTKAGRAEVLAHNAAIKADAKAMAGRRFDFLDRHLQVLRPFVTADVAASIRTKAADARAAGLPPALPPVEVQPACLAATLREYQLEGLRWMVQMWDAGMNAILADEMGLGKTLQTISLLSYLKFERGVQGPHLVVVPLSVLPSWLSEFQRWSPQMRVVRLHTGDHEERQRLKREVLSQPDSFDVAVTTYDMAKSKDWQNALARTLRWRYLVLDEGHKIKNEETQLAHAMRLIQRQQTLLLTGTPLQNSMHELYALLSYLFPDVFTSSEPFDSAFDLRSKEHKVDPEVLEAAHHMLAPLCLRRLKAEVELGMPPLVETRIYCPLSEMQTFWYRRLLMKDSAALLQVEKEVERKVKYDATNHNWKKLQMLVQQLRKCCNHPYLFPGAEPDFDGMSTDEGIVRASGKMEVLDRLLRKLKRRGHRVVLFSQFNMQLDILEDYMIMRGYKYSRLDGSTNRVQRMIDIKLFNRPGSDTFVYLLNTRAGGLGVNLQTADTCILYDSDWNPQSDLQAMARVHRIGQTKPVHVYRLCTGGTIEERIQHRAEKKLFLDQMVNRGALAGMEDVEQLSRQEMLAMLKFGCDRIFQTEAGRPPTDAELDAIINRSSSRAAAAAAAEAAGKKKGGAGGVSSPEPKLPQLVEGKANAASFDAESAPLSTYMLQGKDYSELKDLKDIGRAFWQQQAAKRERKQRLVQIGGLAVLKSNLYDMNQGEPSVFEREAASLKGKAGNQKSKMQVAGRDYEHDNFCQVCWDGGELICCDGCPAAYHADCLGLVDAEVQAAKRWMCPQHACAICQRSSNAVGGMLFRCEGCCHAYCEDHLPEDADVVMENARYAQLGYLRTKVACFVRCTPDCGALVDALDGDKSQRRASLAGRSPGKAAAAVAGGKSPGKSPSKVPKSPGKVALPAPPVVTAPLAAAMPAPPGAAAVAMLPGEEGGVRHVVRSPGMGLAASALARSPAVATAPSPLAAWGSAPFLPGAVDAQTQSADAALGTLFAALAKGTEQPPPATVVVVGDTSPAVQAQLSQLASAAPASLQLPNAVHEGTEHPVLAALQRTGGALTVKVLGECGGAYLAGEQPATLAALRAELEAPTAAGRPRVVVLCLLAGAAAEEQAALLEGAQAALAAAAPSHLLVHAARPPAGEGEQRRRLLAEGGEAATLGVVAQSVGLGKADRANQTGNYTTCDPLCQKHVMWLEGLIILVVVVMALVVGCTCMHAVDTPSRFAQPEAARPHAD